MGGFVPLILLQPATGKRKRPFGLVRIQVPFDQRFQYCIELDLQPLANRILPQVELQTTTQAKSFHEAAAIEFDCDFEIGLVVIGRLRFQ